MSNEEVWFDKLEKVKTYVIEHGKTPPHKKGEKDSLGLWIITQNKNYAAKTQIMKNSEFYEIWTQFLQENNKSFKTNEEEWFENLNEVIKYVEQFKKLPNKRSTDENIKKMGNWLGHQKQNFNNDTNNMKNIEIKKAFELFMKKYC